MLSHTDKQTALILLAEDQYSLTDLMGMIGSNGFTNCVLQGNVAVCGLSGSGGLGG